MQARDQIRANMQAQGVNASGRTSGSIHVREYEGGYQLVVGNEGDHDVGVNRDGDVITTWDTAPAPTLEVGRGGGKVPKGFYLIIKQWSREKGLTFANESERSTFSYFVAKKIAAQGTMRHYQNVDVYTTTTAQAVEALRDTINKTVGDTMRAAVGAFGILK